MKSEIRRALPFLLGACALTGTAAAQDSTSLLSTMPGDSVDQNSTTEQVNDYVVDLGTLTSTSGRVWGVAPLAKASWDFTTPSFYTGSISSQGISRGVKQGVPFARSGYSQWNTAGSGINGDPTRNNPGTLVDTSAAVGTQFGFGFSQFSSDDPLNPTVSFNSIVGGVVNFDPSEPSRLYVTRVQTANNDDVWFCNVAQFGFGAVDADGWMTVRADAFGTTSCGGFTIFQGDNLFLINTLLRSAGVVNVLSDAGAADTGIRTLVNSATTHSPATMIPAAVTGGTPIVMGSNFNSEYVYGSSSPMAATTTHLAAGVTDHRGLISYCAESFPAIFGASSTSGCGANLGKGAGTDTMNIWGLTSTGAPVNPLALTYPGNGSIQDPTTGWMPAPGTGTFGNYFSATAFRGGTGQVAVGKDQAGRLISAGMMHHPSLVSTSSTDNMIAVARTANGTGVQWVVAAYTLGSTGKPVYGAFGSTQVGMLVGFEPGAVGPSGPAISSPMIDSVGNVYFNGRVLMAGESFYRESLVKAIYDPASFSYTLELVVSEGDVVRGGNSGTSYQIAFLQTSGSGGPTPSSPFSQNINQASYNGASVASLDTSSTETLGGLAIRATVIYDVDGDGDYDRQSIDPTSQDQDYQTLLFITSAKDCNSNGVPDDLDLANGTSTDNDGDGVPDDCGVGTVFCLGDGTDVTCPCGNFGASGEGCANSTGAGAMLFASGSASVSLDDLTFDGSQLPPGKPSLLFLGTTPGSTVLGDGILCATGQIQRLTVDIASATGTGHWGPGLAAQGAYNSGDTRYFQVWYRDPIAGPCAGGFNISTGLQVDFIP